MKKSAAIVFTALSILFFSCRSTLLEDKTEVPVSLSEKSDSITFFDHEDLKEYNSEDRYIFIRLYQPYYDNPLCIENVLSNCIKSVDVYKENASHSAIGFSLNDSFYGLTTAGKKDLKIEHCTYTVSNPYMKKCNPDRSYQTTFALKVTEKEYDAIKKMVEDYYNNPKTKYNAAQNFAIGGYSFGRKFFHSEKEKRFAGFPHRHPEKTFVENKYDFVCSSFISYVLVNCVEDIRDFFIEKKIDINYVLPSDLADLPGAKKLFKSRWTDYSLGAKIYSSNYSALIFAKTEYLVSE